MLVIRLLGGIGNQLFQYALGLTFQANGQKIKFDRSALDRDPIRRYRLDALHLELEFATTDEISHFLGNDRQRLARQLYVRAQRWLPFPMRKVIIRNGPGFDPRIPKINHTVMLIGYWQDERYFKDAAAQLRSQICFDPIPSPHIETLCNQSELTNSISLHVRRTDYVTNPKVQRVLVNLDVGYYQSAVTQICEFVSDPVFYIFSDEPDWVATHLHLPVKTMIIQHDTPDQDLHDLYLMSQCKHHILANSSFSWWGAWLADHPNQVVIAPKSWFVNPRENKLHLLPTKWLRISAA